MSRRGRLVLLGVALLFVALQLMQPTPTNPPVAPGASFEEAAAPPPEVARLVERSCADCHSNRARWPWYAYVAPASYLVVSDVNEGREHLNLSEWGTLSPGKAREVLVEMCEEARDGQMPLRKYLLLHRDARLSEADVAALCSFAEQAGQTPASR